MNNTTSFSREQAVFVLDCIELAACVMRGPDAEYCGLVSKGTVALRESGESVSQDLDSGLSALADFVESHDDPSLCSRLEELHISLFVSAKGGVPAPPYASCHGEGKARMMGPPARDMEQRLDRAGLAVDDGGNEPPDHLATQLEYLYFLLHCLWMEGERPPDDPFAFAASGLLPWVRGFAEKVGQADSFGFHTRFTAFLTALLAAVASQARQD